jgi:hypothetical protein
MQYAHSTRQKSGVWFDLYLACSLAVVVLIEWKEEV